MTTEYGLLGPDDPPVFEIHNADGATPLLLICDHASRAVPACLNQLGLEPHVYDLHVAWDIGAAHVTRMMADLLDAPAVMAGYSRLLIDLNRAPGHPQSIPEISDGIVIPGNLDLTEEDKTARAETFHAPYHNAVTNQLAQMWRSGPPPALFSVHSFTPSFNGEDRKWDIGVLWNRDLRLPVPLIRKLRETGEKDGRPLFVGDNEPYSGRELAYSIDLHAGAAGLANCAVEIRQDHLETTDEAAHWADMLSDALREIMARENLHKVQYF
ncbi:MAG: N-formylglutamate amidohydrolase [Hyphomicrobiales bacterium]|nr:N-formylglutamate amidohydrolase [Hyphomicrobiales bacterium]MCP5372385.1 N-formylglutamate amidohydrolase [Hyphomicrobiales bacterium]